MAGHKVYSMSFSKIYECLLQKVERKGKTKEELNQLVTWLTGYSNDEIEKLIVSEFTYEDFFAKAPKMNPNASLIKGKICGVQIENIEEELMRNIRYLDKIVDELAKGKTVEKILSKYE